MKVTMCIAVVVVVVGAVDISSELAEWGLRQHFEAFVAKFGKVYESLAEREARFGTFVQNLEAVVSKNAKLAEVGADEIHGMTKFSDWTDDEFATMVGGYLSKTMTKKPPLVIQNGTVAEPTIKALPLAFDWRDRGVITPVKDQGSCGSCWAHSAAEAVESRLAMNGGPLVPLSVQQIVSCDTESQAGCGGGNYNTAWLEYGLNGLAAEEDYPYDTLTYYGHPSQCDHAKEKNVVDGTKVLSYQWATVPCESLRCLAQDEDTLAKNLVSFGPLSVAVDASEWASYTGGVLTMDSCANGSLKLDHAVQLVGFDFSGPTKYFVVKNSWADDWGLDGYIHLKFGDNTCGIADQPAFVTTIDQQQQPPEKNNKVHTMYKGFHEINTVTTTE